MSSRVSRFIYMRTEQTPCTDEDHLIPLKIHFINTLNSMFKYLYTQYIFYVCSMKDLRLWFRCATPCLRNDKQLTLIPSYLDLFGQTIFPKFEYMFCSRCPCSSLTAIHNVFFSPFRFVVHYIVGQHWPSTPHSKIKQFSIFWVGRYLIWSLFQNEHAANLKPG